MGFYDKFNQFTKSAATKSREVAEITKLNMDISANEQKIKELFLKIGTAVVDRDLAVDDEEIVQLVGQVKDLRENIERNKQSIQAIRNMNICPNCGAEVSRTSKFCEKCGTPIDRSAMEGPQKEAETLCPSCGAKVEPSAKFCESCGAKLSE